MSANAETADPTVRKKISQGDEHATAALHHDSKNESSPEGVKEGVWPIVLLGEIAEVKLGKMLDKAKHQTGRRLPYLRNINVRWGTIETDDLLEMNFEEDQLDRFGLKPNDVLVCEGGEPGRASVWSGHLPNLKFQKALHRVRFKVPFDPRLLVYLLELLAKNGGLERRFTGSTIKHFTREAFVQLPIPFPPEVEQRRIVAEIEKQFTRLDAGVAALRRVQANLKRYRAAVLKAACEGRLVPTEAELAKTGNRKATFETGEALLARILTERRQNWQGRGKYKEPAVPDTTKLPAIPKGWTWLSVETIGFVTKLAGFEYTKYVRYSQDGDLAVIKAENAGRNGFKRTEISRIKSSTVAQLTRSQLKAGDLLMVFVGAGTGNVARVPDDQPYFLGPNIAMIRVEPREVSGAYPEMFLRSPVGHTLTFGFIKAVAQPSLSMGTIRMIPIALPPLAEQTRIVAEVEWRLSVVEELEAVVSANLQRATHLRQSILQKAFAGELTLDTTRRQRQ